ncbi:MAG: cytochrome c [Verrucomicrobiota bacterium]
MMRFAILVSVFSVLTQFSLQAKPTFSAAPTFHRDIAPIVYAHCMVCHRVGESAPFALTNYEEVSKKARTIERAVEDRYMPPWHAGESSPHFLDERRLSDEEIATIVAWVDGGKLEGDPADAPEKPSFPTGWRLGEPDMVLTMDAGYSVPADGPDIYRNFVLPLDLAEDKWIKAVELRASAPTVVHHALYFLDDSGTARKLDGKDGQPGFTGMSFRQSGSLGGYVPGTTPRLLPGDLARPLPKGSDLILSSHFHPSGKPELEQTQVGLYFADAPPTRTLHEVQVPPAFGRKAGIDVPANETLTITDSFTLPVETEAVAISGHAHYICDSMTMVATLPDGTEQVLLDIPEWDLDWQDTYYFGEEYILPSGTLLTTTITYDNTAENPSNPFHPPQRIKWGRDSTDEMGSITLLVVPAEQDDSTQLTRSVRREHAELFAELAKELINSRVADRLPQIVRGLDGDGDGQLHATELPSRMRKALLLRLDADGNETLDAAEIQALQDWLISLREGSVES